MQLPVIANSGNAIVNPMTATETATSNVKDNMVFARSSQPNWSQMYPAISSGDLITLYTFIKLSQRVPIFKNENHLNILLHFEFDLP